MIAQLILAWLTLKLEEGTYKCVTASLKLPPTGQWNCPSASNSILTAKGKHWDSSSKPSSFQLKYLICSHRWVFSWENKHLWICRHNLLFPNSTVWVFLNCRRNQEGLFTLSFMNVWQCYFLRFVRNTSLFWKQCEKIFWGWGILFTT